MANAALARRGGARVASKRAGGCLPPIWNGEAGRTALGWRHAGRGAIGGGSGKGGRLAAPAGWFRAASYSP
ncbi:MAG: hypothetical protein OXN96_16330, partial [Bryobacterales bacterium]|nr:hypothetical protein [Bryobacterales bacterium]